MINPYVVDETLHVNCSTLTVELFVKVSCLIDIESCIRLKVSILV